MFRKAIVLLLSPERMSCLDSVDAKENQIKSQCRPDVGKRNNDVPEGPGIYESDNEIV